jgi:hypothetical protein
MMVLGAFLGMALTDRVYGQDEAKGESSPKITKIVIYKHGLGYFERFAKVKDNETIKLGFTTNQMKDVLTSFFAIDANGGKISTVGYDSKDPIGKQLENILINVPEGAALTRFLAQLKGAKVEISIGEEKVRGSILGIEPFNQKQNDMVITAYKFILLTEKGTIEPFNLFEINSLKLLDEPIQKDLKRVLDIYLNSKYTDRKELSVLCTGKGDRNIMMGYLIEMPIWKTSYRLILDEKLKPYLQGWAIVENPTDEDWDNVEMSFIAGNPISFSMDLYTSYYPQRPIISLTSIVPLVGALFDAENMARAPVPMANSMSDKRAPRGKADGYYEGKLSKDAEYNMALSVLKPQEMSKLMQSSISSLASGIQVGELFAYEAKTPVSIGRHKAAMVPIITENVEGAKILYYRSQVSPRLMNAFYMTNSTKLTLETGPVTLFESSTSVGESLLKQSLQAGMKEILPYAIETGCNIESVNNYTNKPVHKCKVYNGMIVSTYYSINETTYKLTNKTSRNQVVYLDHPKTGGYTLMDPKKPEEEVPGYYRFKMDLAAGKTVEFKVQEQTETSSSMYLQNISMDQIKYYLSQTPVSNAGKTLLNDISELMAKIAEQRRIYNESQAEYNKLTADQGRFRDNMYALNNNNPTERELREKYVKKMESAEEKMTQLKETMNASQEKQNNLQNELIKKINELNEQEK